ncbi:cation diffusion facilitator family transporter [Malonomonas rubra DSM 5091]|uniref:Cation diffusion facilitator family transporter n=1 Tax=Malonomonas rubra DSM 5091 TaxID=1122189 RepID=A0A1M6KID0_MALRU|nr:cation diffusion facilitator family transporter [Malonomonas rubra]SHJ58718.1 cation diffusion facilitator family transporter [Malonomonas rubra DSM 5091]
MLPANPKIRAAAFSISGAFFLAAFKLVIAISSGSMAVMASAVDSLLDILMSGVNFMAIRQAEQPPDECHPFGHGKYETLATFFQAIVISISGGWILYESSLRLAHGEGPTNVDQGIGILAFSAVISWFIASYLRKVAKQTDSTALEADSLHFRMDIYSNLGLMAGLLLIRWLEIVWIDAALSLLVASYILHEALQLIKRSLQDILDTELPEEIKQQVHDLITEHDAAFSGYHGLRTRRAGSSKIMDFHLEVCKEMSVFEAHKIADSLEKKIEKNIPGADVIIHIEPCHKSACPGRTTCEETKTRLMDSEWTLKTVRGRAPRCENKKGQRSNKEQD